MKKLFLAFLFAIFSCIFPWEVFADDDVAPNVLRGLVEENTEKFDVESSSKFKPNFTHKLVTDLNFNDGYQATDRAEEFNDTEARIRFYSALNLSKNISLNSFFELEQSNRAAATARRHNLPNGGGDRSFEDEGIHAEELTLDYDSKNFALVAGKFNPDYGLAWRWDRGIWYHDIAENYRLREKLGLDGIYRLGSAKKTGQYEFGLSAFTNDRKNLDNTVFSKRDSDHKSDAKPGDTRSLQSYVASLDVNFDFGEKFGDKEKLSYHFASSNLAVNERASSVSPTKIDDQKGFVAGMNYQYPLVENLTLDALLEYENTRNLDGNSDVTENYLTASAIAKIYHHWNVSLAYAERKNMHADQFGFDQNLAEISAGYEFKKNKFFDKFLVQIGYKNQRTNYKTSLDTQNVAGLLARYYKYF
jgi:hypothetical protein